MPKFKSKSSWKKRAKFTATGKIKRGKAYRSHLLNSKTTKRKRQLRKSTLAHVSNAITIKSMIPYKRKGRK